MDEACTVRRLESIRTATQPRPEVRHANAVASKHWPQAAAEPRASEKFQTPTAVSDLHASGFLSSNIHFTMASVQINLPLPVLPEGWAGEKDFKPIGHLSAPTNRNIEPVGPHFLAHARRARHKRTFSEDDRIQAEANVKKVEEEDEDDVDEPEDPMLLQREAKDWKVCATISHPRISLTDPRRPRTTTLCSA